MWTFERAWCGPPPATPSATAGPNIYNNAFVLRYLNPPQSHDPTSADRYWSIHRRLTHSLRPHTSTTQGFGFIAPTSGGPDIFVHQTEIKREGFRFLEKGETVEFRVEEGETGRQRAFNVTGGRLV